LRARRAWQSRCWFEIASSLKAPRNDPLGANVNYNVLLVISTHLAELYDVETRVLNQAVKRNISRFPEDFMFQLNSSESELLVSQNVILHKKYFGGSLPYAFTEQDVMLLGVSASAISKIFSEKEPPRLFQLSQQSPFHYERLKSYPGTILYNGLPQLTRCVYGQNGYWICLACCVHDINCENAFSYEKDSSQSSSFFLFDFLTQIE